MNRTWKFWIQLKTLTCSSLDKNFESLLKLGLQWKWGRRWRRWRRWVSFKLIHKSSPFDWEWKEARKQENRERERERERELAGCWSEWMNPSSSSSYYKSIFASNPLLSPLITFWVEWRVIRSISCRIESLQLRKLVYSSRYTCKYQEFPYSTKYAKIRIYKKVPVFLNVSLKAIQFIHYLII